MPSDDDQDEDGQDEYDEAYVAELIRRGRELSANAGDDLNTAWLYEDDDSERTRRLDPFAEELFGADGDPDLMPGELPREHEFIESVALILDAIPGLLVERLMALAEEQQVTVSQLVVRLVEDSLGRDPG